MAPNNCCIKIYELHQTILESFKIKHQLDLIETFKTRFALGVLATTPTKEKVIIRVKGYKKDPFSKAMYQKTLAAHRMAKKIKDNFMPKVIEYNTFEHDNILWIASMSAYGGKPISPDMFFKGNADIIDHEMIGFLRHSIEVIEKSASVDSSCTPKSVQMAIRETFGHRVISVAPEWTSAHCDFHWGNILNGRVLIDWDTFSQAPKGLDAASIVLFSVSNSTLFERLYKEFSDILQTDSGRVATLYEAGRIKYWMGSLWRRYESNIRDAVMLIVKPKKIRWPKKSDY